MAFHIDRSIAAAGCHIPRERRYHVGGRFLMHLDDAALDFHARRLAHLLAHATARDTSHWHGVRECQPEEGFRAPLTELSETAGLAASRCNRSILAGVEVLAMSGLLDRCELVSLDRDWLRWRFRDEVHEALFSADHYGHFDVDWLRSCGSYLDLLLHGHLGVVHRMRCPKLDVDVAALAERLGRPARWGAISTAFLGSLARQAAVWSARAAVLCRKTGTDPGIDWIELRLAPAGNRWSSTRAAGLPRFVSSGMLIDATGGCRRVSRRGLAEALLAHLG